MATKATLKRYSGLQFVEFYPKTTHDQIIASGTPSNTTFLRGDGVWATPAVSGTGDVTGPASSVDNRIAVFNGTTGKIIKDSGTLISGLALASHTHDDRYYTETEIDAKIDFAIRLQIYPQTKNTSGVTIPKGAVVQFAGTQGDFSLIKQAVASEINANPSLLMGLAREAIPNNAFGDVVWFGNVEFLALGSFTTGQILWFDTVNGGLTATEPATNKIQIAAVQKASSNPSATNGILLVRIKYVSRDIDEVDGLTDALDGKLNTSGGTMTGLITFNTTSTNNGFFWNVNSDQAGINFKNTGDGDTNSYLNFFTKDNGNEYIKFSHQHYLNGNKDWMDIKDGTVRINGMIYVNATQSGSFTSGTNTLTNGTAVIIEGDARLSNARTPLAHTHAIADVTGLQTALDGKLNLTGGTLTGDLTISKLSPVLRLYDSDASTGTYPAILFDTANSQGVKLYHTEFDSELTPGSGYGLVLTASENNIQFPAIGPVSFSVLGEIYAGGQSLASLQRVFHDGYHPNADTLTTARTISLAGDVTGSASFNGSSNISITATVADDSHNHVIGNVDGLQDALNAKLNTSARGAANGVASLDANSKIPVAQLPDSVFDSLYFNGGGTPGDSEFPLSYLSANSIRDAKQTNRSPLGYYYVALSGGTFTFTDVWVTFGSPQPPATSFPVFGRVFQQTLTLTQGSAVVPYTFASSSDIGLSVLGTGFPTGTTIVSFTSTTITLSNPATVNGNQSFQFGYYVTILAPSLEEGVDSGSYPTSVTLEIADWFVISKLTGIGTLSNPYEVTWGFVNNTYELADETVHGITKLSNTTTISSSTTGNEVITQGVLGGLIGTAANTIAAGDDARFTDARTPLSHTHGNITNAGAIGTTADLVAVTTTSGVLTTASRSGIDSRTAFPTTYANITGTVPTWNQSTTGNAATATQLQNARTIGGVSFNGTANINLPGVNTAGTQNTSGNAATATNISNTGTVTLATATEQNQITVTAPSYGTDLPVKLLNFHWYSNNFSIGNIRSGGTATNGLGFYYTPSGGSLTELLRINPSGNVGIGTTAPSSAIHIKKATPEIKLEAGSTTDSGTMRYNTTTKSIEFIFV